MAVHGIVPTAAARDNGPEGEHAGVPVCRRAAVLLHGARPLALTLLGVPVLLSLTGRGLEPALVALAVIFLIVSEAEGRVAVRVTPPHQVKVRVGFRWLYACLVVVGAAFVVHWPWVAPVFLGGLLAQSALWMRRSGVVAVTVGVAIANILAAVLCSMALPAGDVDLGHDVDRYAVPDALIISTVVFPLLTVALRTGASAARERRRALERAVAHLGVAREELQRSQQQLQQWNHELGAEVRRHAHALEERNRYLSIINAVSFALAEPMDDARTLERAVRLVARLVGVRAAQAYSRTPGGEVIDLFVTVAPEDLYAPRLPEAVLLEVARTGQPISSGRPDEAGSGIPAGVPDPGEAYHVVPLVAKGRVLGSFALIGTGAMRDDDDGRHLLLLVGREMGVALENARLYREAIEKAGREAFLTEVTRLLNASVRGERVLPDVLGALLAQTSASEAVLVSLPDGSRDVVVAGSAVAGGGEPRLEALGPSLARIVLDRARPLVLGAAGEAPLSDRLAAAGFTTVTVAPILTTRGRVAAEPGPVARDPGEDPPVRATPTLAGALIVGAGTEVEWGAPQTDLLERVTDIVARRVQADEFVAVQQQRIRELTGLAEVARTMQSGADVERLYRGFASALRRLLPYEALYVPRLNDLGEVKEVPAFGPRGRVDEPPPFEADDGGHPWFSLRAPLLWRRGEADPPPFLPLHARYAVAVPMRPKGQMLGLAILVLPRVIRDDQLRIVEQAVEQLSLALDGAALYQQATARASHIQALSNLARIVASVVHLREAFAAFSEEVRWLIPFDRAVMFLLDETEQWVEPYATYPDVDGRSAVLPLARSLASVPIDAGTTVTFRRDDARYASLDWRLLGHEAREVAAVPVRQGSRTLAVFALVTDTPGLYGAGELAALEEVAGLLAVTIERLRLYEHADHSAKHDLLTELPNYRYLQERLGELRRGILDDGQSALAVVDLDSLKLFNDTLGHEVGDRVIQLVARELRYACRPGDFVARTGGDEFVLLMEGADAEAAVAVGERIHRALAEAHREIEGAPSRIGASIGIAVAPGDAGTAAELLQAADQAMYVAKFAGGQQTCTAGSRAEEPGPRTLRGRGRRLEDTLVRALVSGGSAEELDALALAHRWAGTIGARIGLPADSLPELRLVLAGEASRRFTTADGGERDHLLARHLVAQVRSDWEALGDAQAREQLDLLVEVLLDAAWLMMPPPHGEGCPPEEVLRRVGERYAPATALPLWPVLDEVVRTGTVGRRRRAA